MRDSNSAGAPSVQVDFLALERLSNTLRNLASELGGCGGAGPAITEPDLCQALGRADGDWSSQRGRLISFLQGAYATVDGARQAYQQADDAIAASAGPK